MSCLLLVPAVFAASPVLDSAIVHRIPRLGEAQLRTLLAGLDGGRVPDPHGEYHRAHARWALARLVAHRAPGEAAALLAEAERLLEGRSDPEALALLGQVGLEQMSREGMLAKMKRSPGVKALFDRALALAPQNPRVLVLCGKGALGMPIFLGGGPAKAIPLLEEAVKQADGELQRRDAWAPAWGRFEGRAWLAWAYAKAERWADAEREARIALQLDPGNAFVKDHVGSYIQARGNR